MSSFFFRFWRRRRSVAAHINEWYRVEWPLRPFPRKRGF